MRRARVGVAAAALLVLAAACTPVVAPPPPPPPPPRTPPGVVPAGLPAHVGVGLSASPDDLTPGGWVAGTGVPFDYAYQYLAAGVNTGQGWQTWNSNATFPVLYADAARARGTIPVFSYFMMLQSNGSCGTCGEAQRDLTNLNTPALMDTYYADFATLMQRLGSGTYGGVNGAGGTTIVQVEPDLSGYAEQAVLSAGSCYGFCTGTGNDPTLLRASVASSGYAAAAGYPDTYQGFNLALLHLRDVYAPNVLLAFHVSDWAVLRDIGSDPDPTLSGTGLGQMAGAFAAASGVTSAPANTSTYDLVFNDVDDRDAGYYKYVDGRPNAYWDRLNVTVPDFARWEDYLRAVTATTGRRAMVWQVPLGNQYFDTDNNTPGHYQDNRAEYFFGHMAELQGVGVIAVLYGRGNPGSTTNTDAQGDGVTNPPAICTSDGLSSGTICNGHTSTVADDDGGYLRMAAAAYEASPIPAN
ncbi:MAG TPA: hypothetical protein VGU73_01525 [Acidimicrobiia bacterium]|nr:hypothetical protein [Acidimicrobiia bacterium]